jgi:excisionase family DNA binding protein
MSPISDFPALPDSLELQSRTCIRQRNFRSQHMTNPKRPDFDKESNDGGSMADIPQPESPPTTERLAYSIQESADMLGVNYFSVYRLIQRGKLKACRALRGKLLVPRTELLKLLKTE